MLSVDSSGPALEIARRNLAISIPALLLSFAFYPYVYLLARTALAERAAPLMEAARMLDIVEQRLSRRGVKFGQQLAQDLAGMQQAAIAGFDGVLDVDAAGGLTPALHLAEERHRARFAPPFPSLRQRGTGFFEGFPMTIQYDKLIKHDIPLVEQTFTQRDTMLYALGVGLGADPMDEQQLQYVYEKNLKALPTMAIILGLMNFASPWWMTFRQAQERGGGIRKGERGALVMN